MHARVEPPATLLALAEYQAGVVSTAQARECGLTRSVTARLVHGGGWRSLERGILQVHTAEPSWEARAWAGHLMAGEGSMLAGLAAGCRQGLVDDPPDEIHLLVPHVHTPARRPGYRFERRTRLPRPRGALPLTPPAVTVIDLCALEPPQTVQWVTTALRERITSPKLLRQELALRGRLPVPVRQVLDAMLDDAQGLESPLEELYLRRVERAHGLPSGVRQFRRRTGRHDIAYPWGLLVELDGRVHASAGQAFRDMERDNGASLDGWWTHRYGYQDCWIDPCGTAVQVARKLRQLGWRGLPHSCPDCRALPDWSHF